MGVGTVTSVWGQQQVCRGQRVFAWRRRLLCMGTTGRCLGTVCVRLGTVCVWGHPCTAWPVRAWSRRCALGDSCCGHGHRDSRDTADASAAAVPGRCRGSRAAGLPPPRHRGAAPPGPRWVTLVAPGEGLGPSCLLRELAHALLNAEWDGARPTRVTESSRSLHLQAEETFTRCPTPAALPALFPQFPTDQPATATGGCRRSPAPRGAQLRRGGSTSAPRPPSPPPLSLYE